MKRVLALMLALLMAVSCFAGCDDSDYESYYTPDTTPTRAPIELDEPDTYPTEDEPAETEPVVTEPAVTEPAPTEAVVTDQLIAVDGEQISYVMIYNPQIYTSDYSPEALRTGTISNQINVDLNKAGELEGDVEIEPYDQPTVDPDFLDKINLDGGKADGLGKFYMVGDQEVFYCGSQNDINTRTMQTFTCVYAGTHANIWVYTDLDQNLLTKLGNAFDSSIYQNCVSRFGEPRFGEIVNFLVYPFDGNQNTVGFFHNLDLFSFMECDDETAQSYGVNRDINVVNMNALWLADEATFTSTLAHEFQHLLCFTGYFSAGNQCDVWFNEAMSGYIEEELYPGSKASSVESFHLSERIRFGQSLYNFGTDVTSFKFDIGVYGSVYLFSEYMKNIAGGDVFSNFHENWRNTYYAMDTFDGIYEVIPDDVRAQVDSLITYPDHIYFASESMEWVSKFTLSFYLSTFTMDNNTPENYRNLYLDYLLYDSIVDANIEGGGRVILATLDGTFEIPEDADDGLVYVGLNENMQVVTNIVCN